MLEISQTQVVTDTQGLPGAVIQDNLSYNR